MTGKENYCADCERQIANGQTVCGYCGRLAKLPSAPSPAEETACGPRTLEQTWRLHYEDDLNSYLHAKLNALPEPVSTEGAAEVCDECGRPSNQLSEDSEKFLLCPACTVAHPSAPEAAAEDVPETNELIRALMSARAMIRSVQWGTTWAFDDDMLAGVDDVIARAEEYRKGAKNE